MGMTEFLSYSTDPLVGSSQFFDARVRDVNEEIKKILCRTQTLEDNRLGPAGFSSYVSKANDRGSSSEFVTAGKPLFSCLTVDSREHSYAYVPPSAPEILTAPSFALDDFSSVPLAADISKPFSIAPHEPQYWEAMCRVEVSKWMERHLRSHIEPLLTDFCKSFISTQPHPFNTSSTYSTSNSFSIRKEIEGLKDHFLELQQLQDNTKHHVDGIKLECLNHYRHLQSSVLQVERQVEQAAALVHHETEENLRAFQKSLSELQYRELSRVQERINHNWESAKKEMETSLFQQYLETKVKMANMEERFRQCRAEVVSSIQEDIMLLQGRISGFQRELEHVQKELAATKEELSEQCLLVQMLRDEKILNRSELRGCKRDLRRLKFVLKNFLSLHFPGVCSSDRRFSSQKIKDFNRAEDPTDRAHERDDNPIVSICPYFSHPFEDSVYHTEDDSDGGEDSGAQAVPHPTRDSNRKKCSSQGLEKSPQRWAKELHVPRTADWRKWVKALQEQIDIIDERQRHERHHCPCPSIGSPEHSCHPCCRVKSSKLASHFLTNHLAAVAVPSTQPPSTAVNPLFDLSRHGCTLNANGIHQPDFGLVRCSFHTHMGCSEIEILKERKNDLEDTEEKIHLGLTPRGRGVDEKSEGDRVLMGFSTLDTSSLTVLDSEGAYPPPPTSDSESDRDNHHLSRLAID